MTALEICANCPESRKVRCLGFCPCAADPQRRDIAVLAELHECPLGKFRDRGLGDKVARALGKVGIPKCGGCGKRQKALNRLLPFRESAD